MSVATFGPGVSHYSKSVTRFQRFATLAVVFLGGALLMATEIVAFRIIGKSFGSALRETTAVIAVFLASMSVGYWAGGRAGDRWPLPSTIAAALSCAAATLVAIPWLDPLVAEPLATSSVPLGLHAFVATMALFAVPSALFASVSPIAVRLFTRSTDQSGSTAGSISALSTVGSIVGSVATAFFLLEWLESINRTVIVIAISSAVLAAFLLVGSLHPERIELRWAAALPTGGVVAVVLISGFVVVRSGRIDASLLQDAPGWETLFVGDSAYHHINVREWHATRRFLSFGLGVQSSMEVRDPFGPGRPYSAAFHIGRLIRPGARRVLSIGLGGGTAAKQFTHDYPDVTVDAVEVDPVVANVAERFFDVKPDQRLRIHVMDGRTFLRRSSDRWDLVLIDAYTTNRYGATIPPHLVTLEFLREVAAHLNPGGIVHFHCAFGESNLLPALEKTMRAVFPATLVTDGEIVASNAPILITNEQIAERAAHSPVAHLPHLQEFIAALHPVGRFGDDIPLLTDDYAPIDLLIAQRR